MVALDGQSPSSRNQGEGMRNLMHSLFILIVCTSCKGVGTSSTQASDPPTDPYAAIDHYGVFVRNAGQWVELTRQVRNFNYGNVFLTNNRAFNGVTSETGPLIGKYNFELVIYGQQECSGVERYEIRIVNQVGNVNPPVRGIAWVVAPNHLTDVRRGPVQSKTGMCRIWMEPNITLPPGQFYFETALGHYFFRARQ